VGSTADEVRRAHGFTGERLLKLCRKIANDKLARLGRFMHEQRLEDLVGYLALQGVQAGLRYDPERVQARYGSRGGEPFASWLADILDHRVTDWYRSKAVHAFPACLPASAARSPVGKGFEPVSDPRGNRPLVDTKSPQTPMNKRVSRV
jgi:hypothetical protein